MFFKQSKIFDQVNTLRHPHLSIISLRKNTSSDQDLQCKSWLEVVFLQSEIRERRGWCK